MRPPPSHLDAQRLLPIVCALILAAPGMGWASSLKAAPSHAASEHDRLCSCKGCRGEYACCCVRPSRKATAPRPDPAPRPKAPDGRPCFNALPCDGGAGLPTPGSSAPAGKMMLPPGLAGPSSEAPGPWHALATDNRPPSACLARLDDPPESPLPA